MSGVGHAFTRALVLGAVVAYAAFAPGAAQALPGQVDSEQKISDIAGSFLGTLEDEDQFGFALGALGDLDGNMVRDVAAGVPLDDDGGSSRGAVWILFMSSDGTVASSAKISDTAGGFSGTLENGDQFGFSVASLGDLDGDTVTDIAVGAAGDDDGGGGRGAVWILFLNANGSVKAHQKISDSEGGFAGALADGDQFGSAVAGLGDVDGDTVPDLAVGASLDNGSGTDRGAVWILLLNSDGTVKDETQIDDSTTGLSGNIDNNDFFGFSLSAFDDLDDDGVNELAVGTINDDGTGGATAERGAVWMLFLNDTGGVKSVQKIGQSAGNFAGALDDSDMFGSSVAQIRDIDGDGVNELAVGAIGDDDGGTDRGAVWVLFMLSDGTVNFHRKISSAFGNFTGPLDNGDFFGSAIATPRDLDADGIADLVVGARRDDDGGTNRGALYVLFLDGVPGAFCGDGILDPSETCDDFNTEDGDCCSSSCQLDPEGTPCPNDTICDGDETCNDTGVCFQGTPLDCSDGDLCTQDLCDPIDGCMSASGPATVCLLPGRVALDIKDRPDDTKDRLKWRWKKGEETLIGDFGNPLSTTDYALCIYDGDSGAPVFSTALEVPAGLSWITVSSKGYRYKDKLALAGGVRKIELKAGVDGKPKLSVDAKGMNFPAPIPFMPDAFFEQDPSVIVQLINSEGLCWTSEFAPPAQKSDDSRFKDRFP